MRIAVLISGGVDSAVVVHKLYEEGHDLHLYYIKIGLDNGEGECSADEDIEICNLIARKYSLPLYVVSLQEEYWEYVVGYLLENVKKGYTPNPDIMCNKLIKFGFFEQRWGKNYDKTATGHYASIINKDNRLYLAPAKDPIKDQTDFLARITYEQLEHLMFPLGNLSKEEVRDIAVKAGLPNATRKDSQGICFLGKINYSDFLKNHLGEMPGDFVEYETGEKIGIHRGFWFYTIGQRKGLRLGGGPWFVVDKNIDKNIVYLSNGYETPLQYGKTIYLDQIHWITSVPEEIKNEDAKMPIVFKTRHSPEIHKGTLNQIKEDLYTIDSEDNIQGIAPGQYTIIYSRDHKFCYGSGRITQNPHKYH